MDATHMGDFGSRNAALTGALPYLRLPFEKAVDGEEVAENADASFDENSAPQSYCGGERLSDEPEDIGSMPERSARFAGTPSVRRR